NAFSQCLTSCNNQLSPESKYNYQDPNALGQPPGTAHHALGTNILGKDMLSQIIYGGKYSLGVAFLSVLFSLITGGLLGLLAGYYGGWLDTTIMRIMDVMLAIPYLLLAIVLSFSLKGLFSGFFVLIFTIWIVSIPKFARVMRG